MPGDRFAAIRKNPVERVTPIPVAIQSNPAPTASSDALLDGLAALQVMRRPRISDPERWAGIIADATALLFAHRHRLLEHGWTVADVFGLNPLDDMTEIGLAYTIRGARVLDVNAEYATIIDAEKRQTRYHYRRADMPPPIWLAGKPK